MRERKEDLPDAISVEGVSLKGTEFGPMSAAHGQMAKGTDLAPVLEGLPGDKCQVPHWGYVIEGAIEVLYQDGSRETVRSGELYYWPPGHTVRFLENTTYVEFSPAGEMRDLVGHVKAKMGLA